MSGGGTAALKWMASQGGDAESGAVINATPEPTLDSLITDVGHLQEENGKLKKRAQERGFASLQPTIKEQ
ncbi:hypothetical protein NDU88_008695 [Pleurodeles waltl]|uniref:Uncharacterized protein n=1 Tax=Pleurodeles waltl TaxID=8319 RepID=A0AAV7P5T1_PLEWA|nr:hypothetical protein NDU88_008695 [Pleurodeles waltl]